MSETATATAHAQVADVSRIEMMLNAARKLPSDASRVFDALYVRNLSDAQVCAELGLTEETLQVRRTALLRCLRAAAA